MLIEIGPSHTYEFHVNMTFKQEMNFICIDPDQTSPSLFAIPLIDISIKDQHYVTKQCIIKYTYCRLRNFCVIFILQIFIFE